MRNRSHAPILFLALALLSTACGSDKQEANPQPTTLPSTPSSTVAATPIEVLGKWSSGEQNRFQEVINAFQERNPGTNVRYRSAGDEIADELERRRESLPDIAILPQPGLLQQLARQKVLKPIDALVGPAIDANYGPLWRGLGSAEGVLYGVWYKATNKSTIWYHTEAFAGLNTPGSWEDLVKLAGTMSSSGTTPFSVAGADGWTLTDWFENVYLRDAGPEQYDKLTRREIPWTDDSVKKALNRLAEIFGNADWLAGGAAGALDTNFERSVVQVFGDTPPKAVMVYEGDAVAGVINEKTRAKVGADANTFPFPAINGSKTSVVAGGDVAVLMSDNPVAKDFIRFLATPEAAEPWARAGGFTSPNKRLSLEAYPVTTARQAAAALTTSEVVRFDLSDQQPAAFGATAGQGMWKILQNFLRNPTAVDSIAEQLEAARAVARF